jgi:PleD family two-component response regulator
LILLSHVVSKNIPALVFTDRFSEETRLKILDKNVIECVLKNIPGSLENLIKTIKRLIVNQTVKVLVVDDSKVSRMYIFNTLKHNMFQVFDADNGVNTLTVLKEKEKIKVLVTDYNMLVMDGFELLTGRGCFLVGMDTPSVDPQPSKTVDVHLALLKNDMSVL